VVPIILAFRFRDAQALAQNTPEDDAILGLLEDLRQGGKRELDTTPNKESLFSDVWRACAQHDTDWGQR
jgi:hypothetical protein